MGDSQLDHNSRDGFNTILHRCPFCKKRWMSGDGLERHLDQFVGILRRPADGVHDVLRIQAWFQGADLEEDHRATVDAFPFLRLPTEIRLQVYLLVLTFPPVIIDAATKARWSSNAAGRQYNAEGNLLSLLIVNRQIYDDARYVLYSRNSFLFRDRSHIVPFVVAMGRHNAIHLRAVAYQSPGSDYIENLTSLIQQYTAPDRNGLSSPNLWNDPAMYDHFREALQIPIGADNDFEEAPQFERRIAGGRRRRYRVTEYYEFNAHLGNSVKVTMTLCLQKKRYYG